jgi:type 1 glutamine amidotransferase
LALAMSLLLAVLTACGGAANTAGGFNLALPSASLELEQGRSAPVEVSVGRTGGFTGPVTVTLLSAPAGVSAEEVTVAAASSSATMTLRVAAEVPAGSYRLGVRGASGRLSETARLELTVAAASASFRVLTFSKTALYRNEVTEAAVAAVAALGAANGFAVDHSEDAGVFTDDRLAAYDAVIFLMPSGRTLDAAQQAAFERYIRAGGGFVGVHSAAIVDWDDPYDYWPWYEGLVGAYFHDHSDVQPHTIIVEDRTHPSTAHLPGRWEHTDEIYNFFKHPRDNPNLHILLKIDVSSVPGNDPGNHEYRSTTMGSDHPVAWYQDYDGGRSWYTSMGDTFESWQSDALFLQHILGGILYAAGR